MTTTASMGRHNDDDSHTTATSDLLRIMALISRTFRNRDLHEDGADALRTLREARSLTRPWLQDAEARQAEGKRGLRVKMLDPMYDKIRDWYDKAGEEIERLERRGRRKHGKHRHRRRHRSRDRSESSFGDYKKPRSGSHRDPTDYYQPREPWQAPPPSYPASQQAMPDLSALAAQMNMLESQIQEMISLHNESREASERGRRQESNRGRTEELRSYSSPSPGPSRRPYRKSTKGKSSSRPSVSYSKDTSRRSKRSGTSSRPSGSTSGRTSYSKISGTTSGTKPSSRIHSSHQPPVPHRQPTQQQPAPSNRFGAGPTQYSQATPWAQQTGGSATQQPANAANGRGQQPMQYPPGGQWPQQNVAGTRFPASAVPNAQAAGIPWAGQQAQQRTAGQGSGAAGMQGMSASGTGQPYSPHTARPAAVRNGGGRARNGIGIAGNAPTPASGPSADAQNHRPQQNQPSAFQQPSNGGGFMPSAAMHNNGSVRTATRAGTATPRPAAPPTSSYRPGVRSNPADAWVPGQPGLAPDNEARSSRSTRASSVASWADSESTLMPDDASNYSGRQHKWAKAKTKQAPEPQVPGAWPEAGEAGSQSAHGSSAEYVQGPAGKPHQEGSRAPTGTSSRATTIAASNRAAMHQASAAEVVEDSPSDSSSSSSSESSSSASSSEQDSSSSSRTTVQPAAAQQPSAHASRYGAAQATQPRPVFPGSYAPSARTSTNTGVPFGAGIPYQAGPQDFQQPYVPPVATSGYASSHSGGYFGTNPQPAPAPSQQQRTAQGAHTPPVQSTGHATGPAFAAPPSLAATSLHASAARQPYVQGGLAPPQKPAAHDASNRVSTIDMGFRRPVLKKKCHHSASMAPSDCDSVVNSQDPDSDDE